MRVVRDTDVAHWRDAFVSALKAAPVVAGDGRAAPAVVGVSPLMKPLAFHRRLSEGVIGPAGDLDDLVVINGAVYVGRPDRLLIDGRFDVPGALAWRMPTDRGWDIDTAPEFAAAEAAARA